MFSHMVTIQDNIYSSEKLHSPQEASQLLSGGKQAEPSSFATPFLPSRQFTPAMMASPVPDTNAESEGEMDFSRYIDIPLLVSDNEEEDSDNDASHSTKRSVPFDHENTPPPSLAVRELKRSILKDEVAQPKAEPEVETLKPEVAPVSEEKSENSCELELERSKVMKIVVKYIAMKIRNSFPPESPRTRDTNEMPLDKFLMILVSRLQLTLPMFMRGIIYLFRYMDIIYLLRYLNQSNNFANYNEMGYGLKKLIVGCFKLSLARERITKDWSGITGLANSEINSIVKTLVSRLNGKLMIKNIELIRLKSEIFRFVKMVTKTV